MTLLAMMETMMDNNQSIYFVSQTDQGKEPKKASPDEAGFDLYAAEDMVIKPGQRKLISTDIAMQIPRYHYGQIFDRSGMAWKNGLHVMAGVIDSTYRGIVKVMLFNTNSVLYRLLGMKNVKIKKGDRIAQIVILLLPGVKFVETGELDDSTRGDDGFGSTGKN